jgi:peptide chain release factor 2
MLIDDLKEKLASAQPDIKTITSYWTNAQFEVRFNELANITNQENFWQHDQRDTLLKEFHNIKELFERYNTIVSSYKESQELIELFQDDEAQLAGVRDDIHRICRDIAKFKLELLLNKKEDSSNCYLSINAGAGGTESQDWANMLLRMYIRFCERENFHVDVLDFQSGEEAGIKSATLYIKKRNATGLLKGECGVHRLVRISPFDANKRRHTSFAAITILPEVEDAAVEVLEKDLRIDTFRAGGAGGQHVNKTESAIRITHIPTGIVVQCQNERSQGQNKQIALKMLKAKLFDRQEEERRLHTENAVDRKKIEWGSQIRSYVLHPYKMVKDHRTDFESSQPDLVLDGELMDFIETYLVAQAAQPAGA